MARNFDGVDDVINCGSRSSLDDLSQSAALTVFAWINPASMGEANHGRVIEKRTPTTIEGWVIDLDPTNRFRFITDGTAPTISVGTNNDLILNTWNSIAVTYDDNGTRRPQLYANGHRVVLTADPTHVASGKIDANGDLRIGNESNTTDRTFDGDIAEVAIWDVLLTVGEINSLMRGITPDRIRPNSLRGYWPLIGANLEPDLSGNGSHASVLGPIISDTHPPVKKPRRIHRNLFITQEGAAAVTRTLFTGPIPQPII